MSPATAIFDAKRHAVRVLVADADNEIRSLYRESLRLAGCDVVDAADGRDALVKALTHRPTVVITETRLPIFDGFALCEVLRRDSTTRGVPILVVTTETRHTEWDRARDAGADAVLIKPITPDALLNEIQRLLQGPVRPDVSATERQRAAGAVAGRGRRSLIKAHLRFDTTTPPTPAPQLLCPFCDTPLIYHRSHVGGVSLRYREQWDQYTCQRSCGTFEYRQRTRKLRRVG